MNNMHIVRNVNFLSEEDKPYNFPESNPINSTTSSRGLAAFNKSASASVALPLPSIRSLPSLSTLHELDASPKRRRALQTYPLSLAPGRPQLHIPTLHLITEGIEPSMNSFVRGRTKSCVTLAPIAFGEKTFGDRTLQQAPRRTLSQNNCSEEIEMMNSSPAKGSTAVITVDLTDEDTSNSNCDSYLQGQGYAETNARTEFNARTDIPETVLEDMNHSYCYLYLHL